MKLCLIAWNSFVFSSVCELCVFVMSPASFQHRQSAEAAGTEELGQIWHTSQPRLTLSHMIASQHSEK